MRLTTLCIDGGACVLPPTPQSSCISIKPVYRTSSATWLRLVPVRSEMAARVRSRSGAQNWHKLVIWRELDLRNPLVWLVRAERLELPTFRFEVWRSIQLNYARIQKKEGRILLKILLAEEETGASEGAWTLDHWNHNPELYQLSYARHPSNTNDLRYMHKVE